VFIYIVFSFTQIVFDLFEGFFNTAIIKLVVTITFGFMLNLLCISGLDIIAWIIVFIPFLLMTVIIAMLLYYFGLKPTTGRNNIYQENPYIHQQQPYLYQNTHLPRRSKYCCSINQPHYHGLSKTECLQYPATSYRNRSLYL